MLRILLYMCFPLVLLGCTTVGEVTAIQNKALQVNKGMNKEDVNKILGPPGNRSFNADNEAWQYCETGMLNDTYVTVWFKKDKVKALSNYNDTADFLCTDNFKNIDWTTHPDTAGTVNININVDN
jgi:outer membrane protein assembly factor BamE (lipoprotein component of BamABCDE complex)